MRMLTSFLVRALWHGLNDPICVRSLGMAPSQHQHCTDEAQLWVLFVFDSFKPLDHGVFPLVECGCSRDFVVVSVEDCFAE